MTLDHANGAKKIKKPTRERFVLDIPPYWTRDDLIELKEFLATEETGSVDIWISVRGIEKNTKFSLASTDHLKKWADIRMNP